MLRKHYELNFIIVAVLAFTLSKLPKQLPNTLFLKFCLDFITMRFDFPIWIIETSNSNY